MKRSILLVDDESDIQSSLSFALKDEGFEISVASSPAEAEKLLEENSFDLGLFDVWFPVGDGLDLLKFCKRRWANLPVVMMSGHGNIELALKSIRMGAYDFLEKPLELEKVLVVIRNALEAAQLRAERERLASEIDQQWGGGAQLMGESAAVQHLREQLERAAPAAAHVLVLGENGSGKEVVARTLHRNGPRRDKPFVALNCAGIPETLIESELFGHEKGAFTGASHRHIGRFEQAADGTLFLDEIAELSPAAQAKLLRVLEERVFERVGGRVALKTEARFIAATNRDLASEVRAGRFREDLYFRLKVLCLNVPPLRERGSDVVLLARHFLQSIGQTQGRETLSLGPELEQWMLGYEWPGNVRELRNLIERMLIMNPGKEAFGVEDLPEELQVAALAQVPALQVQDPSGTLREIRAAFERSVIEQRIESCGGNITRAAASLGIERAHLYRKLKQYGLSGKVKTELFDDRSGL